MRSLIFVFALIMLLAPTALAADSYTLTSDESSLAAGAFQLAATSVTTDNVEIVANAPMTWVREPALAAPANVDGQISRVAIYLETFDTSERVGVEYGFVLGGAFTRLGNATFTPIASRLNATVLPGTPLTGPATVGLVRGDIFVNGTLPAGSLPALRVTSTRDNAVIPAPSLLGATSASSATVPLPELPALVLTGVGLLAVAGIVLYRRR